MTETKRDFNADRALIDAATAGPWVVAPVPLTKTVVTPVLGNAIRTRTEEDARFIAEARTGWPAALDEIERLRKYAGFLRSVIR